MDKRLYGKSILIGKEPQNGRLLIALNINNKNYMATFGEMGSVNNGVSRCMPDLQKGHCRLAIDMAGHMTVQNLKEQNVTFVNGMQIVSKAVQESSIIEMGQYRYAVGVADIIGVAGKMVAHVCGAPAQPQGAAAYPKGQQAAPKAPVPAYDLRPLRKVWDDYHDKTQAIRIRQKKLGLFSSITPIFTLSSGAVRFLPVPDAFQDAAGILFFLGLAVTIWSFYARYTDKSIEEMDHLTDEFQHRYLCPNPDCRHFMGMQPYHLLEHNDNCPYCKCKYKK